MLEVLTTINRKIIKCKWGDIYRIRRSKHSSYLNSYTKQNIMKTKFVKETDDNGRTYIIEGEIKPGNIFSIKRFICEVQKQETDKETQEVADLLIKKLNS